ncbi:MAG: hypothetical protein HY548_03485 [Elusimicrobia bacterium]|nr:hypothetical protein [Elusimicrobiota bacterium]
MATISGNGMSQEDLVNFLQFINTNLTGVLAKLDAESLSDSDYESTLAIAFPSTEITENGITSQGSVLSFLNNWVTNFNALNAKLDADGTVNSTNYASANNITDVIESATAGNLKNIGIFQGNLVNLLQTIVTKFNATNAKLDLDSGVSGTNYASLWNITDTIDNTACTD